jgi:hypothetical protein
MLLLLSLLFDFKNILLSFPSLAGTSLLSLTHLLGHEKIHVPFSCPCYLNKICLKKLTLKKC